MQPAHWYFTAALPKALLSAFPLAAVGAIMERRVRPSIIIAMTFVSVYSVLPHKEVRRNGPGSGQSLQQQLSTAARTANTDAISPQLYPFM